MGEKQGAAAGSSTTLEGPLVEEALKKHAAMAQKQKEQPLISPASAGSSRSSVNKQEEEPDQETINKVRGAFACPSMPCCHV